MREIVDPQPHRTSDGSPHRAPWGGGRDDILRRVSPSISDYLATLENPAGVFRTLNESCEGGELKVERDLYGTPALRAGNSAAVFTYLRPDPETGAPERRFLKCYIRPNPHLHTIYGYIERTRPALLPEVRLLREELFVMPLAGEARWVDVVEGAWTEGATLDVVLARLGVPITSIEAGRRQGLSTQPAALGGVGLTSQNIGSRQLGNLAASFADLCRELRGEEWAHGDLKPENIVVGPDGAMSLIDCDAMWVPELAGKPAVELGTPGFKDPARGPDDFDKSIDDHAMARIAEILRDAGKTAPNLHSETSKK